MLQGCIMVPNEIFAKDCPLSSEEKIVFIACLKHEKEFGCVSDESIGVMARWIRVPEKRFRKAFAKLIEIGYLTK